MTGHSSQANARRETIINQPDLGRAENIFRELLAPSVRKNDEIEDAASMSLFEILDMWIVLRHDKFVIEGFFKLSLERLHCPEIDNPTGQVEFVGLKFKGERQGIAV